MRSKLSERDQVIELRRRGLTYSEILDKVKVSKSSVSVWLKDAQLTSDEKRILKKRRGSAISRRGLHAAASLRNKRILRDKELLKQARMEFQQNIGDPFFQVGVSLYWAEGAKRASSFGFTNSDVEMVKIMLTWIRKFLVISEQEIKMRVYTHKAFSGQNHELFWSKQSGIPLSRFGTTIYKTHQGLVVKKRPNYSGCIRIELGKVVYLRKLLYWQQMLIEHYSKKR